MGSVDGCVAGLALALAPPAKGEATILSLYVAPEFRQHGLARKLMQHLECDLRARGAGQISLGYLEGPSNAVAMPRILADLGWDGPKPERLVCCADRRVLTARWIVRPFKLPEGYEIFSWADLRADERDALIASQAANPWIPPMVDPFGGDGTFAFNSVGLRERGAVVGWLVTAPFDSESLMYACSYIRPDLQPSGYIIALYAEAIRRQSVRPDLPKARWAVPYVFPNMVRFVRRWVAPYANSLEDYVVAKKSLAASSVVNARKLTEQPACTAM
jgi:hypothetical protein